MTSFGKLRAEKWQAFCKAIVNDDSRRRVSFIGLSSLLTLSSLVMTIVNFCVGEYLMMGLTLLFSGLCVLDMLMLRTRIWNQVIYAAFSVQAFIMAAFFIISGQPGGFSVLWIAMIPSFALLIFDRRAGNLFCILTWCMVIFFFWIPMGRDLLHYSYSEAFMLRFPFLYGTFYGISVLFDLIRRETKRQLILAEDRYRHLYRHDELTGLYNRYGINEIIDAAFEKPEHDRFSVMILDIDDFKSINDHFGHSAGDQVLRVVAHLPKTVMCRHFQFCRWGGEEFMALSQCDHDPAEMAERVRRQIEQTMISYEGRDIHVTVSIGVCLVEDISHVTIAQMINQADACLYEAKENGKNRVVSAVLH